MRELHSLLRRQLRRYTNNANHDLENETELIKAINEVYWEFDADRNMLEHSMEITSQELLERNLALGKINSELEARVEKRTQELNQLNSELEHANRAKDEFLANMSHELRTPLNSILGLSEILLEQRRGSLNDRQQKALQTIESSGQHLLQLVNDILDVSKIEAGKLDYYPELIRVDEICQSGISFIKSQAAKKSILVSYKNEASVGRIFADPRRLKQILVNLLTNAIKFTPENGLVTLEVRANPEQELIRFSVIDTGIGITPDNLARLFQPFVQVNSKLNREYEGTGLGLALVQRLTDLHGGSVQVESDVQVGSRFTVNLPWRQEIDTQQVNTEAVEKTWTGEMSQKSDVLFKESSDRGVILLAEDNAANILTISEYLENYGYRIVCAHDGLEAIEKARESDPHIILMDIQMPVMDGLEAMRNLRSDARFASTPIIALTALAMPGDRERCLAAGANEYLSKPVSLKNLSSAVSELIAR